MKFTKDFLKDIINNETKTLDEKIESIFSVRGREIADKNKAFKDLELELLNIKETYTSPEDLEAIVAEKTSTEEKLASIEQTHAEEVQKIKFEHKFHEKLKTAGAKDVNLVKAILDMEKISFEDGEIKGFDEELAEKKNNYEYLFESAEPARKPGFSKKLNLGATGSVSKEEFANYSPTQRNELFKSDPALYSQLTGKE